MNRNSKVYQKKKKFQAKISGLSFKTISILNQRNLKMLKICLISLSKNKLINMIFLRRKKGMKIKLKNLIGYTLKDN